MAEHPTWWTGDRDPSISDTLTINGTPVDLSTATVTFKMRAVGSSTLKVNQPVSFKDATGLWRYDWGATDLDTAGDYLAWIEVTRSSKTQTLWESLIGVRAHANSQNYVELEDVKSSTEMTGTRFGDKDILRGIGTASRVVDKITGQRFYLDADANQVRYFTADSAGLIRVAPLSTLTALEFDFDGDGVYEDNWTALTTQYRLEPVDAATLARPYMEIRVLGTNYFPTGVRSGVKVTGRFGWASVPEGVKEATAMLAIRFTKVLREAPLGVAGFGADGAAVRVARDMPDVLTALDPYILKAWVA